MKRVILLLLAALLLLGCFACGAPKANDAVGGKLRIVATVFPVYDWAKNVLGGTESAELILLCDNGVDLHSFAPSAADILTISTCDLFLYVGGESDAWVTKALGEAVNRDMVVVSMLDSLGEAVKEEERVEGMEGEEEDGAYDEHVWLSLQNASVLTARISDALAALDPDRAESYRQNAADYTEKLGALDASYRAVVESGAVDTLLFADRFPFRYLTDDYGLRYYAAFAGCEAETEASFETVTFLARKVDELGLKSVLVIESSDKKLAETVVRNTESKDQHVLVLNSMQSVTAKDVQNGFTYLSVMEQNLAVLKEALQ